MLFEWSKGGTNETGLDLRAPDGPGPGHCGGQVHTEKMLGIMITWRTTRNGDSMFWFGEHKVTFVLFPG